MNTIKTDPHSQAFQVAVVIDRYASHLDQEGDPEKRRFLQASIEHWRSAARQGGFAPLVDRLLETWVWDRNMKSH